MTSEEGTGLKQVIADPVLAAACHQAAHAVAGILLGIPFAFAEIGPGETAGSSWMAGTIRQPRRAWPAAWRGRLSTPCSTRRRP